MSGRLIAVVGPSGVGKDSVIAGLAAACPGLVVARRVITRPPDETEPFVSVTAAEFDRRTDAGDFALHWKAHGLRYGIPAETLAQVRAGRDVIANLSRTVLVRAAAIYPGCITLVVTASPETIAQRLGRRGREDRAAIAERLARSAPPSPPTVPAVTVCNDGALPETVATARAHLFGGVGT